MPSIRKSEIEEDGDRTLVYPATTTSDGGNHGRTWETPDYFYGMIDDGSMWLRMELKYSAKPDKKDVEAWLKQLLAFEIGQPLARRGLELTRGATPRQQAEFDKFLAQVAKYLAKIRKPKSTRPDRLRSRKRARVAR